MQKAPSVPPLLTIFWIALISVSAIASFVLAEIADVFDKPIQALPTGFWIAAFLWFVVVVCMPVFVWRRGIRRITDANKSTIKIGLASELFCAAIFLLMSFFNNLLLPAWGGSTILYLIVGLLNAGLAVSNYLLLQTLRKKEYSS